MVLTGADRERAGRRRYSIPVSELSKPKPNPEAEALPFLDIRDLVMTFQTRRGPLKALDATTLAQREGEFLSVVGPSGCGKSTLLLLIAGIFEATSGKIVIDGKKLNGPYKNGAVVFQQDNLLEWRTVIDNVMLPVEIRGLEKTVYKPQACQLLTDVGLEGFENSYPHQLSGGMRQRAAICRALICDLPLLLMDEPFGALDAISREEHQQMLQDIWLRSRRTLVFVTHDIREAVMLSDRVAVMTPRPGRIRDIVTIDLARPRRPKMMDTPEFNSYVAGLRTLLNYA